MAYTAKRLPIQQYLPGGKKTELGFPFSAAVTLGPMVNVRATVSAQTITLTDELPAGDVELSGVRRTRDDPTGQLGVVEVIDPVDSRSRAFTGLAPSTTYTLTSTPIDSTGRAGPSTTVRATTAGTTTGATRDPRKQPFSETSFWNTPVGDRAVTVHAGLAPTPAPGNPWGSTLGSSSKVVIDPIWVNMDTTAPLRVCSNINEAGLKPATPNWTIPAGSQVHIRDSQIHNGAWNGVACLIRPGGKTYVEAQSLYRRNVDEVRWAYTRPKTMDNSLRGPGREGMHGGSGISGLGGIVTWEEWQAALAAIAAGRTPPRLEHCLSSNLFGHRFMSRSIGYEVPAGTTRGGFTWPALVSDSGYDSSSSKNYYAKTGQAVPMMGSLLRLPPSFDRAKLTDPIARWIADCLFGFGTYIVDNTAWDAHAFSMDQRVRSPFGQRSSTFHGEIMSLFSALHLVTSNRSNSVGGGGNPVVAPPPALIPA